VFVKVLVGVNEMVKVGVKGVRVPVGVEVPVMVAVGLLVGVEVTVGVAVGA